MDRTLITPTEAERVLLSAAFSPPSTSDRVERPWAEANRRSAESAQRALALWFGPRLLPLLQGTDRRPVRLGSVALPVADLVRDVESFLSHGDLDGGRLEVAAGASPLHHPPPEGVLRTPSARGERRGAAAGATAELLVRGTTVILNGVVHGGGLLDGVAEALDVVAGTRIGINAYLSGRGADGFGAHWDDHDVLIVQLHGAKRWVLEEPLESEPVRGVSPDWTSGVVVGEELLEPGDALWVPRGHGHHTVTESTASVHLTVYLPRVRLVDLLPSILRRAIGERYGERGADEVARAVRRVDGAALLGQAAASALAMLARRRHGSVLAAAELLAEAGDSDLEIGCSLPGGFVRVTGPGVDGWAVAAGGYLLTRPEEFAQVLTSIGPVGRTPVTALRSAGVGHAELCRLVSTGLVHVVRPS